MVAVTADSANVTVRDGLAVTPQRYTILSPVLLRPDLLASAVFIGPAMEIAVEEVNEIYRGRLHFSLQLLADPRMAEPAGRGSAQADCFRMLDNVQDVVSDFIFRGEKRSMWNESEIVAIVAPGSCVIQSVSHCKTQQHFSVFNFVSKYLTNTV